MFSLLEDSFSLFTQLGSDVDQVWNGLAHVDLGHGGCEDKRQRSPTRPSETVHLDSLCDVMNRAEKAELSSIPVVLVTHQKRVC